MGRRGCRQGSYGRWRCLDPRRNVERSIQGVRSARGLLHGHSDRRCDNRSREEGGGDGDECSAGRRTAAVLRRIQLHRLEVQGDLSVLTGIGRRHVVPRGGARAVCSSRRWVVYLTMSTHIVHMPWCPEPASELPYLLRTNQHPSRSLARTGRSHQSWSLSPKTHQANTAATPPPRPPSPPLPHAHALPPPSPPLRRPSPPSPYGQMDDFRLSEHVVHRRQTPALRS